MTIGIINAMHKEHEQIVRLLSDPIVNNDGVVPFVVGNLNGHRLVLAESGIGKVNAAIGAVELIKTYHPDMLINTGVAGGVDTSLRVMDVVAGVNIAYHDVDCGPESEQGQVQGLPLYYHSDYHLVEIATSLHTDSRVLTGLICSGDQFITNREQLNAIKQRYPDGLAVDMESGSLAQVCYIYKVPFLSFRIISDTPGAEAHFEQYQNFWGEMADRSFGVTKALLNRICSL